MNGKRKFFKLAVLQKVCNREFDLDGDVASFSKYRILFCTSRKLIKLQCSVLCCGSGSGLDPDSMGWFIKSKFGILIVIWEGLIPLFEGLEAFFGA